VRSCADLSFPEAVRLGRALVQVSSLGRSGSSHILKWLLACLDPGQQVIAAEVIAALTGVAAVLNCVTSPQRQAPCSAHALADVHAKVATGIGSEEAAVSCNLHVLDSVRPC